MASWQPYWRLDRARDLLASNRFVLAAKAATTNGNRRPSAGRFSLLRAILLLWVAVALAGLPPMVPAMAAGAHESAAVLSGEEAVPRVLRSDPEAIELEFEVAGYDLRTVTAGGRVYDLVEVAGLGYVSDEGAPQVPVQGSLVGIPPGARVELEILAAESEKLPGQYSLLPAPTLQVAPRQPGTEVSGPASLPRPAGQHLVADEAVYGADAVYPGEIVRLGEPASLRSQRLVAVQFYPVQYNPRSGEVVLYRRVRVRLNLTLGDVPSPTAAPTSPVAEPEAFESVLAGALLNYEPARDWRQPPSLGQVLAAPQWRLDAPAYRLIVDEEGIYQVTYADLQAALGGSLGTVDAGTLQVYYEGQQVAIRVLDGGEAGIFGPGDSVLFYGQKYETKYTAENVYWLTYGQGTTLPMGTYDGSPGSGYGEPASTERTVRREENGYYTAKIRGDDELERYWWTAGNSTYPMQQTADLGHVAAAAGNASLRATLFCDEGGDHHVRVVVNGEVVGNAYWSGEYTYEIVDLGFPHDTLQPGENQVHFEIPGDAGDPDEVDFLDWFEITYQHEYRSAGDQLWFLGGDPAQDWEYAVRGFTASDPATYEVYDLTNPALPVQITGAGLVDEGNGTYTLRFEDSRRQAAQFLAQTTANRLSPLRVELDAPSDLTSSAGADYIIISHAAFLAAMEPLHQLRGGLLVDVADVYDEFGYGRREPAAIRDFLAYAYGTWETSYALLVGDGHRDPKDYEGEGRTSFIPAYLIADDPWLGEVPTDNWYADVVADTPSAIHLPEIQLGRLPANTEAQAQAAVEKVLAYEDLAAGPWATRLLFVADDNDPQAGNFPVMSDTMIAEHVPDSFSVSKAYLFVEPAACQDSASACGDEVVNRINDGRLLVNFIGHAQPDMWAFEPIVDLADIERMGNAPFYPMFLPMTCQEGAFHYPFVDSAAFGEAVVMAANKGAIASWSPTGFGQASSHDYMNAGFLDEIFRTGSTRAIGPATLAGRLALVASVPAGSVPAEPYLLDTYILFGDPAVRLKDYSPTGMSLSSFEAAAGPGDSATLRWETAREVDLAGFHLYRVADGQEVRVNAQLIRGKVPGLTQGAAYDLTDGPLPDGEYAYWLEAVDIHGATTRHGPATVEIGPRAIYLPLVQK